MYTEGSDAQQGGVGQNHDWHRPVGEVRCESVQRVRGWGVVHLPVSDSLLVVTRDRWSGNDSLTSLSVRKGK
jgi:hypothetical protein